MAKITDIALIGGIALVAFLAIRAGRDLFGALPELGKGIDESLKGTQQFIADSAAGTQAFFAQQQQNFSDALQQQQTNFSNFFESLQGLSREPVNIVFNEEQQKIADETGRQLDELDCKCGTSFVQGADGQTSITCIPCQNGEDQAVELDPNDPRFQQDQGMAIPKDEIDTPQGPIQPIPEDRPTNLDQFAQFVKQDEDNDFFAIRALEKRGFTRDEFGNIVRITKQDQDDQVVTSIPDKDFRFEQAEGGSFAGGSVFETPIERLSLGQIIRKFGVTASQAADIRASAADESPDDAIRNRFGFGDFDFGTNTGSGLGSVFERPEINVNRPSVNVSDPRFEGLSAIQIRDILISGGL